jgi:murein DD-endopeptidase MepM/ murein hydrolase activator NlpD
MLANRIGHRQPWRPPHERLRKSVISEMLMLYVLPLVAQVAVPIALLAWLWCFPGRNRAAVLLRVFMTAVYLAAVALASLWLVAPWILAIVYLAILALEASAIPRRVQSVPRLPRRRAEWIALGLHGLIAIAFVGVLGTALNGRRPPREQMVELEFPLRGGAYYVANGGSSALINGHVQTLTAPRFRDYRGQSYAVDIVKVDGFGMRARGFVPRDLRAYVIFGEPIHAPCSGVVLRSEDGLPDMPPPEPDREHLPGNFVFMECDGVHVLLGHMMRGTVRVRPGQQVQAGDVLGNVGNSGNTNEPDLHIHAQRPARSDAFLSGDPLPVRLDGRFLVRNDRATNPRPSVEEQHGAMSRDRPSIPIASVMPLASTKSARPAATPAPPPQPQWPGSQRHRRTLASLISR